MWAHRHGKKQINAKKSGSQMIIWADYLFMWQKLVTFAPKLMSNL